MQHQYIFYFVIMTGTNLGLFGVKGDRLSKIIGEI